MANEQIQAAFEQERKLIKADVKKGDLPGSVFAAIEGHYRRLDGTAIAVMEHAEVSLDCKKGCNFCCHFKTEAGPEEIFRIVEYIESHFDEDKLQAVTERAKSAQNLVRSLPNAKRIQTNIPCALLEDGACSVYSVRPSVCRKKHSTDVTICEASYDRPDDATIQNAENSLVSSVLLTMSSAARQGLADSELDAAVYDLNERLAEALGDKKHLKRWKNGKKAFV